MPNFVRAKLRMRRSGVDAVEAQRHRTSELGTSCLCRRKCYAPPVGFLHAQAAVVSPMQLDTFPLRTRLPPGPPSWHLREQGSLPTRPSWPANKTGIRPQSPPQKHRGVASAVQTSGTSGHHADLGDPARDSEHELFEDS